VENIKAGQLQAALLLDPAAIKVAKQAGLTTINMETAGGSMVIMNSGVTVTCNGGKPEVHCAGKADGATVTTNPATKDPLVRRAVAAAIDPEVINTRVYQGAAHTGSALFYDGFAWDPKVPGPKYDPAAAKDLIAQAKAKGFDGSIRLVSNNDALGTNWGVAMKTMLDAVGFNTQVIYGPTGANVTAVLVNRDYDLSVWGLNIPADDGVFGQLFISFHSKSNRYGYSSPEMDAAIDALRVATTDEQKTAALAKVSELYVRDAPFMIMTTQEQTVVASPQLHGMRQNSAGTVVLDKAWLAR
jgi:peptide/nickel transport system substrate-binding protein